MSSFFCKLAIAAVLVAMAIFTSYSIETEPRNTEIVNVGDDDQLASPAVEIVDIKLANAEQTYVVRKVDDKALCQIW